MRGTDIQRDGQFRAVIQQERVPADHLLHPIRVMVNTALKERHGDFNALYRIWSVIRFPRSSYCECNC